MEVSNESRPVRLTSVHEHSKVSRWVLFVFVENENIVYSED